MVWTGRVLTVLVALFLLFDAAIKILRLPAAVEGTRRIGYPVEVVAPIGIALLVSLALYLVPRTAVLGAILLTGYLGGATASMVRMSDHWFLFPVLIGVLAWVGLYLRDEQLRTLVPLRRQRE
jgi:hypothetical protein